MAPRRNYNKIPVIDKTRLRESFNRGEDFPQLAKILGINRTTAYSIVNRDQDKERSGKRQTKVDDDMKTAIADYLESNPLLTSNEINFRLRANLPQNRQFQSRHYLDRSMASPTLLNYKRPLEKENWQVFKICL